MKRILVLTPLIFLLISPLTFAISVDQDRFMVNQGEEFTWNVSFDHNVSEENVGVVSQDGINVENTIIDGRNVSVSFEVAADESGTYSVGLQVNHSVLGGALKVRENVFTSVGVGLAENSTVQNIDKKLSELEESTNLALGRLRNETDAINNSIVVLRENLTGSLEERTETISDLEDRIEILEKKVSSLREEVQQQQVRGTGHMIETGSIISGILILVFVGAYVLYRRKKGGEGEETTVDFSP